MKKPVEEIPKLMQHDLGQILEKLKLIRKTETESLCKSLVQAMTTATQSSISLFQNGPKLPNFHKFSTNMAEDDITCCLVTFEHW